eukprot:SAG22_NODE_1572_length_4093_cov_18.988733_3_plen_72_part_00
MVASELETDIPMAIAVVVGEVGTHGGEAKRDNFISTTTNPVITQRDWDGGPNNPQSKPAFSICAMLEYAIV